MNWWQDPEQCVRIEPGEIFKDGTVWYYKADGNMKPVTFPNGSVYIPMSHNSLALYRRVYPEVVSLRMQVQDLTEENENLKKQVKIYAAFINNQINNQFDYIMANLS